MWMKKLSTGQIFQPHKEMHQDIVEKVRMKYLMKYHQRYEIPWLGQWIQLSLLVRNLKVGIDLKDLMVYSNICTQSGHDFNS